MENWKCHIFDFRLIPLDHIPITYLVFTLLATLWLYWNHCDYGSNLCTSYFSAINFDIRLWWWIVEQWRTQKCVVSSSCFITVRKQLGFTPVFPPSYYYKIFLVLSNCMFRDLNWSNDGMNDEVWLTNLLSDD